MSMKKASTNKLRRQRHPVAFVAALSLLALAPVNAFAGPERSYGTDALQQQSARTASGTVKDVTGEPVIGASIVEKDNPKNGTITDVNGKFTLKVAPGAKLIVSYIGFKQLEVTAKSNMSITMSDNTQSVDEVVVVAYGTRSKKSITGSLSQVSTKDVQVQNNTTLSRSLEGAAPGIQIASVDGQPGLDAGIRIRGVSSANGNSANALIVVDGVMQETNTQYENPLSRLNPSDIADITVLKDAASTALYGSRAANGVILITTKSGQAGKPKISFDARWGWNSAGPHDYNSISTAAETYEYVWKCIYNSYRYGVSNGLPKLSSNGQYVTNVANPNHTDEEARLFASQHLFDYVGSETNFQENALGNNMAYYVPGATYTMTGSGNNSSATMSGAYLIDPTTGLINSNARLLYDNETMEDLLLKTRFRQEYNVSASGGNDRVHYFFSLGYQDDPSYVRNSKFRRYSGRSNLEALVTSWLKVGANVNYTNSTSRLMAGKWGSSNQGASSGNTFNYIYGWSPVVSYYQYDKDGNRVYDADGNAVLNFGTHRSYSPLGTTQMAYGIPWDRDLVKEVDTNYTENNNAVWSTRLYAEARFLKYFTFRSNFNMDENNYRYTRYMNSEAGRGAPYGGVFINQATTRTIDAQQLLSYSQDFNKVHHVDAMFGHEYESIDRKILGISAGYELLPGYVMPGNFAQIKNVLGGATYSGSPGWSLGKYRTEAYFGSANYSYADRYYLSGTLRRDGASKFRKDKRWGTFWSVGGGWRFSDEEFMKPYREWLDNGKLRLSYGVTGNSNGVTSWYTNNIWTYGVATWKTTSSAYGTPSTFKINAPGSPAQDDITWENVHQFDVGLDLSFLNSRITATLDYYNNLTVNSLFAQAVSPLANLNSVTRTRNCAKLRNAGFELEIGADIIRNKNFTWHVSTNGTHYRTTLVDVPEEQKPYWDETIDLPKGCWTSGNDGWASGGTDGYANRGIFYLRGEGKDYYNIYIRKYAGVDQSTGLPMYWHRVTYDDVNKGDHNGRYKDYKVGENVKTNNPTEASYYEEGSATPAWIGGFSTSFRYKDFDLSIVAAYQLGGKFLSQDYGSELYRGSLISGNGGDRNLSKDLVGNTWTPENTSAYFPMQWWTNDNGGVYFDGSATGGGYNWTDMSLFSASYLRIKNITFGYTMPRSLTDKIGISKLRAYLSLDNMFLFSAKPGIDPSLSTIGGMEVGSRTYPQMKTVTLGLNLEL